MLENRRRVLQTVAAGASGFVTFSSLIEASEKYMAAAGDGGYGRAVSGRCRREGDAVAFHDPKDVAAMPEFRFALDGAKPRSRPAAGRKKSRPGSFP